MAKKGSLKGIHPSLVEILEVLKNYSIELLDVADKDKLPYISHSRLKLYQTCPRAFSMKYAERKESNPTPEIIFGKAMHSALEFYNERIKEGYETRNERVEPSFDSVLDAFNTELMVYEQNLYPREKISMPEEAQGLLSAYYLWDRKKKLKPIEIEYEFLISIDGIIVNGVIDLITNAGVWDYKTAYVAPKGYEADISLQLSLYSLVYYKQYDEWPEYSKLLYLVKKDKSVKALPIEKNARRTIGQVEVMIANLKDFEELSSRQRFLPTPNFSCQYCSYAKDCPAVPLGGIKRDSGEADKAAKLAE